MVPRNIFRENDIRGLVDKEITPELAKQIGAAFGTHVQNYGGREIIVSRDNRPSSGWIRDSVVAGLTEAGCNVIDIGEMPVPVFYFSLAHLKKNGGVMITGSHVPKEFNGFKLCIGMKAMVGEEIQEIRRIIEAKRFRHAAKPGAVKVTDVAENYLSYLRRMMRLKKPLQVVVDAGNAVAGKIGPQALREIGCKVTELYCESDGTFPHHFPDPEKPANVKELVHVVKEKKADLGIAYDGDGDRLGVVDEKGRVLFADRFIIVVVQDLLKQHPGAKILFDVKCSQMLIDEIKRLGGTPLMWKTGHALVKKKMKEENAALAVELSGHIYFSENFNFDDAIFASCKLAEVISKSEKTLSELLNYLPVYYTTTELLIPCADDKKFVIVEEIKNAFKQRNYNVVDVDGARVVLENAWGLIRASNTSPNLSLRFEGKTEKEFAFVQKLFEKELDKFGLKIPQSED